MPVPREDYSVQPELGFQRVMQRAAFQVKSRGENEVGVDNVLVAVFSEKHSHAALLLKREGVTRIAVVNT